MKCSKCNINDANVYIEQQIGSQMKKMHLCNECAFASDMNFGLSFMGVPVDTHKLDQAFKHAHNFWFAPDNANYGRPKPALTCTACRYSFERFKKSSLLGCAVCYDEFKSELAPVLTKLQPASRHIGKVPKSLEETLQKDHELTELKAALKTAIDKEEYEEAAKIRDTIRTLEGGQVNA